MPLDEQDFAAVGRRGFPWVMFGFGVIVGAALVYLGWRFVAGPWSQTAGSAAPSDSTLVVRPEPDAEPARQRRSRSGSPSQTGWPSAALEGNQQRTGGSSVLPTRPEWEIRRKLAENRSALGFCYQAGQANDPTIEGTVVVQFRVESDGRVVEPKVSSTTLNSPTTEECILRVISQWRFSSGKKADTFELAFPFARQ